MRCRLESAEMRRSTLVADDVEVIRRFRATVNNRNMAAAAAFLGLPRFS
jgi:hypothetical protein